MGLEGDGGSCSVPVDGLPNSDLKGEGKGTVTMVAAPSGGQDLLRALDWIYFQAQNVSTA